jgi:monoamine oxidase
VANKVFLELQPGALPFDGTTSFVASSATPRTVSFTVRPGGQDLVLAYFGGGYARELEEADGLEAAAREELVRLFGGGAGHAIGRITATAWSGDPWARGSYSAARPGFAACRETLARPVAGRVFFAGDACTADTFGAIHGAWASGVAAARNLAAALRGDAAGAPASSRSSRGAGAMPSGAAGSSARSTPGSAD